MDQNRDPEPGAQTYYQLHFFQKQANVTQWTNAFTKHSARTKKFNTHSTKLKVVDKFEV